MTSTDVWGAFSCIIDENEVIFDTVLYGFFDSESKAQEYASSVESPLGEQGVPCAFPYELDGPPAWSEGYVTVDEW